jgi:KaiC/GvpD/RAD55 family RecA-like ATPase
LRDEGLAIQGVRSYVKQMDTILGGGFPVGSKVLISGAPGTMKTSLAYALVYNNAFADKLFGQEPLRGLYISIEQDPLSILKHVHNMDMRLMDNSRLQLVGVPWQKKTMKKIQNVHWEIIEREGWLDSLKRLIAEQVEKNRSRLMVLDSLTAMMDRSDSLAHRDNLFELFEWLGGLNAGDGNGPLTTFLINEQTVPAQQDHLAAYLADGTIKLFSEEGAPIRRLFFRCDKMRMANHDRDAYLMDFHNGQFTLNPVVLQKKA